MKGKAGAIIAALLFGFVFLLIAVLVVALALSVPRMRRIPDWAMFSGIGIALLAAASFFGVSIRLALSQGDDGE